MYMIIFSGGSDFILIWEQTVNESNATVLDTGTQQWLIMFATPSVFGFVAAWVTRRLLLEVRGLPHQTRA